MNFSFLWTSTLNGPKDRIHCILICSWIQISLLIAHYLVVLSSTTMGKFQIFHESQHSLMIQFVFASRSSFTLFPDHGIRTTFGIKAYGNILGNTLIKTMQINSALFSFRNSHIEVGCFPDPDQDAGIWQFLWKFSRFCGLIFTLLTMHLAADWLGACLAQFMKLGLEFEELGFA